MKPTPTLPQSVIDFAEFLNEPPQYEDLRMVRDYRHEAWARFEKVISDLSAALSVDDWTVDDTETAGEILTLLGIGCDASKEPGADWRRDKIAKLIRARISQQDAELERLQALYDREKAAHRISVDEAIAEARKAAFIEAAEIAVVFAGKHEPSYGLVSREIHEAILAVVGALRAKAEETER